MDRIYKKSKKRKSIDKDFESSDEEEEIQPEIDELLKLKVTLKDGTKTFIFSRGPKHSEFKIWPVTCHFCKKVFIRSINEPETVLEHTRTKRHKKNVNSCNLLSNRSFVKPFQQSYPRDMCSFLNPIHIYPGEIITDITTAYADRLVVIPPINSNSIYYDARKELIKNDKIIEYNKKFPLFGLNGIIKTRDYSDHNLYYCVVCEGSVFYDDTCFQHITGKKHTTEYISKYFPKLNKRLTSKLNDLNEKTRSKYIFEIVRYMYSKLEEWKGKREFTFVPYKSWTGQRDKHLRYVRKSLFYHENIVKFSSKEINELLTKLKKNIELIPPDLKKLSKQLTDTEDRLLKKEKGTTSTSKKATKVHSKKPEKLREKPYERNRLTNKESRFESQAEKLQDKRYDRKHSNIKESRFESQEKKLQEKQYERNHSITKESRFESQDEVSEKQLISVTEDWKIYRKKCENKIRYIDKLYSGYMDNPETHTNYKRKWEEFFKKRSEELKDRNINALTYDFGSEWKNYWFKKLNKYYLEDIEIFKESLKKRLELPLREETPTYSAKGTLFNSYQVENIEEVSPRNRRSISMNNLNKLSPLNVIVDQMPIKEKITVLSALRHLNAIEEQLGSFALIASQLLTDAIIFEKETKSCSNKLLEQDEYYKFFITTVERLKGLLQAELVVEHRIKAVEKAISNIDEILKEFDKSNNKRNGDYHSHLSKLSPRIKRISYEISRNSSPNSHDDITFRRESSNYSAKSVQKMRTPPPPIGFFPVVHSRSNSPEFLGKRKRPISPQLMSFSNKRHNLSNDDDNGQNRYNYSRNDSVKFGNRNPSPPKKRSVNHNFQPKHRHSPPIFLNNLHSQRNSVNNQDFTSSNHRNDPRNRRYFSGF